MRKELLHKMLELLNVTIEPSNMRKKEREKESLYVTKELSNLIL